MDALLRGGERGDPGGGSALKKTEENLRKILE